MKLKLIYTHENADAPILSRIVLKTGIPINIIEAKVTPRAGEMVIDVLGSGEDLKEAVRLFQEAGVVVREITSTIEIDLARCVSCGACVSPCPVHAMRQKPNWEIEFDDKKCVGCGICVDACPIRVIRTI